MLNEVLFEVMFFADRDDLDTMQLSSRFMLDVIRERETAELPLRPILQVDIGTVFEYVIFAQCLQRVIVDFTEPHVWDEGLEILHLKKSAVALLRP